MLKKDKGDIYIIVTSVFLVLGIQLILVGFSEQFFGVNDYNSYTRQAVAWIEGRLDLGENISWLELAVFDGKYYVSFPPFPSYIMLPFAYVFGLNTPDNLITLVVTLIGTLYATRISLYYSVSKRYAVLLPVMLYGASAVLQITLDSGVWFFAQNFSFTLTLMSLYYMLQNCKGRAMFFLCCAVGCRPLQICVLPFVLIYLLIKSDGKNILYKFVNLIFKKAYVYIPATILALSYMILNYVRFGNVFEFGHNYLPEFTSSEYGQFDVSYITENFGNLFVMPSLSDGLILEIPKFNGMNIFISFPVLIFFVYLFVKKPIQNKKLQISTIFIFLTTCLQILVFLSHKTLGGYHYGNRYIADVLPLIFLGICMLLENSEDKFDFDTLLFDILVVLGLVFNTVGIVVFYQ